MRINKVIAARTGLSRRAADRAIAEGRVQVNGQAPQAGQDVLDADTVTLDGQPLGAAPKVQTIMLNKPTGYVVSRDGQGSQTVYDLLPPELHHLKPVGRLDKYSSGLLLLTNDGQLAEQLTHPRHQKVKRYYVRLSKPLTAADKATIEAGVQLEDGPSKFPLTPSGQGYTLELREGRNRQIRRTFAALGYGVPELHRTHFGDYALQDLKPGAYRALP